MSRVLTLALILGWLTTVPISAAEPDAVWIYRGRLVPTDRNQPDNRTDAELKFAPFGYMPGERANQIAVNPTTLVDKADPKQGCVLEYAFQLKRADDWVGSYHLVGGDAWGSKPGINVQKLLGVGPKTELALRFRARGNGVVTFKIGGVGDGKYPSSLAVAREVDRSPTRLTPAFAQYDIGPIPAEKMVNLIDPFVVVASCLDNLPLRGKELTVQVDEIRIERFAQPKQRMSLPDNWRERLAQTLFICYTPTGFDPTANPVKRPGAADIQADIDALIALAARVGLPATRLGLVTYGCKDGLEQIVPLASKKGLAVILGIFDCNDAQEVANAEALLRCGDLADTIAACCVGNEMLTFRRGTLHDIQNTKTRLRRIRAVPMSTSEIAQAYGKKGIFDFDLSLVNAHALFSSVNKPEAGAKWAAKRIAEILELAPPGHLALLKEAGWPDSPAPFDAGQQALYWKTLLRDPIAKKVNICVFDGIENVAWKDEPIAVPGGSKVNIGPHWPVLLDKSRKPKPFAEELLKLWMASRDR